MESEEAMSEESVDINKAIESFGQVEKLTEEQEQQLLQGLHQHTLESLSFTDAVTIVSQLTLSKMREAVKSMSDEEKVQTYQELNLK